MARCNVVNVVATVKFTVALRRMVADSVLETGALTIETINSVSDEILAMLKLPIEMGTVVLDNPDIEIHAGDFDVID